MKAVNVEKGRRGSSLRAAKDVNVLANSRPDSDAAHVLEDGRSWSACDADKSIGKGAPACRDGKLFYWQRALHE